MENFKLKNVLYIGSTLVLILVMICLTFMYLSSHKELKGDTPTVHKSVSSSSKSSESSNLDDVSKSSTSETSTVQTASTSEQKTETSDSKDTQVNDVDNNQTSEPVYMEPSPVYMEPSEFRYLYTAAGGDTLQTVFELTGVDVATLARVNNVSEDIILSAGQEIYVP